MPWLSITLALSLSWTSPSAFFQIAWQVESTGSSNRIPQTIEYHRSVFKLYVYHVERPSVPMEGTAFIVHTTGDPNNPTLYFLTAAHVIHGSDATDDASLVLIEKIEVRFGSGLGDVWTIDKRTVRIPAQWQSTGRDFAIFKVVGAGRKVASLPVLISNPLDRAKFQAFGFPQELPTVISVEGTVLNLGEGSQPWFLADSSLAPGMSGGPASVSNGVFAIVEGAHKSNLKFLVPLSLSEGFLKEQIPGWNPANAGEKNSGLGLPPKVAFRIAFDEFVINEAGSIGARWDLEVVANGQQVFLLDEPSYKSLTSVVVGKDATFGASTGAKILIAVYGSKTDGTRTVLGEVTIPEGDITEAGITRGVRIRRGPKEGSATLYFQMKRSVPTVSPNKEYPLGLTLMGAPISVLPLNIAMSLVACGPDQTPSDLVCISFYYPKDGKTPIVADFYQLQEEKYQRVGFQMKGKRLVSLGSLGTFQLVIVNTTSDGNRVVGVDLTIQQIQ